MTRRFPIVEKLVVDLLLRDFPELADEERTASAYRPDGIVYHVGDAEDPPPDLATITPYVRVAPAGSPPQLVRWLDVANLDIDVWHTDRDESRRICGDIREYLRPRLFISGRGVIDTLTVTGRPQPVAWADDTVSRYLLQVQVSARRTGG